MVKSLFYILLTDNAKNVTFDFAIQSFIGSEHWTQNLPLTYTCIL